MYSDSAAEARLVESRQPSADYKRRFPVDRIDPFVFFYQLGHRLTFFRLDSKEDAKEWLDLARLLMRDIEWKVGRDGLRLMPEINKSVEVIKRRIRNVERAVARDPAYKLTTADSQAIADAIDAFEASFSGALSSRYFYVVRDKGGYSTVKLIEEPECFLGSVWPQLPDNAKEDFRQAALCMGFDLPTACGFHSVRAVESLLRRWYDNVLGPPANPGQYPNMGQCIDQIRKGLKNAGGPCDKETAALDHLDTIRRLDRNPLMHPEIALDQEEALQLFGKSIGALVSLVKYIL